jgi:hypothetical protein
MSRSGATASEKLVLKYGKIMARKPNYNFERNERDRIKAEKKAARAAAKQEAKERKAAEAAGLPVSDPDDELPSEE